MRLTSVKLSGFKSFVDPTTIAVPGQLVGVVSRPDVLRWLIEPNFMTFA